MSAVRRTTSGDPVVVAFDAVAHFDMVVFRRVYMEGVEGADVNVRTKGDLEETFVHVAIRHLENDGKYALLFDYLAHCGADLNAANAVGDTPLHYAVAYAKPLILKWLLIQGVDVWIRNSSGELAVDLSVKLASRASGIDDVRQVVTQLLQSWMPEDKSTLAKLTSVWSGHLFALRAAATHALFNAAASAMREFDSFRLAEAVDSGAELNEPADASGLTLLMVAAHVGSLRYVTYLVERGADVTAVDASARTVLHHAVHHAATDEHADVVRFLAAAGAPLTATDAVIAPDGSVGSGTPLQRALALPPTRALGRVVAALRAAAAAPRKPDARSGAAPRSRKAKRRKGSRRRARTRARSARPLARSRRPPIRLETVVWPRPKTALEAMEEQMHEADVKARFKVGDRVVYKGHKGSVAYVGTPRFAPGVWVGIALDEAKGRNAGIVDGKRYFVAPPNSGIFCRPTSVVHL